MYERFRVGTAVRFGREQGMEIGARGGGHSVLGLSIPDGGLMVDLSPLGAVRVDPVRRRAWVEGGALLSALDRYDPDNVFHLNHNIPPTAQPAG